MESTSLNLNGSSNNLESSPTTVNEIELRNQLPLQHVQPSKDVLDPLGMFFLRNSFFNNFQTTFSENFYPFFLL